MIFSFFLFLIIIIMTEANIKFTQAYKLYRENQKKPSPCQKIIINLITHNDKSIYDHIVGHGTNTYKKEYGYFDYLCDFDKDFLICKNSREYYTLNNIRYWIEIKDNKFYDIFRWFAPTTNDKRRIILCAKYVEKSDHNPWYI